MDDHRVHSIPQAAPLPGLADLGGEHVREEVRIEEAAIEIEAGSRRILAARPFLGEERGQTELKVDIIGTEAAVGDAQLAHSPLAMELRGFGIAKGEVLGMGSRVGRDGLRRGERRKVRAEP
jgi:hypothetical protein